MSKENPYFKDWLRNIEKYIYWENIPKIYVYASDRKIMDKMSANEIDFAEIVTAGKELILVKDESIRKRLDYIPKTLFWKQNPKNFVY